MPPHRDWVRFALIAAVLVGLAHLLDPWAQLHFRDPEIYQDDFGRLLRVIGYYPLWVLLALALFLHDRAPGGSDLPRADNLGSGRLRAGASWREAARRAGLLLLTPALGGFVAEVGKLAFRRRRPGDVIGEYLFRGYGERPFHSGGLGLPSSHTLVAFAGAAMLARLFPRGAPIWYLLAAGCGLSRVAAGAHWLSDVVVAGILGWLCAWLLWRWNFGRGEDPALAVGR